jgi:hypothetical protein
MLIQEIESNKFIHTYSNVYRKIKQTDTGEIYDDALDVIGSSHTYEETDQDIDGYKNGEPITETTNEEEEYTEETDGGVL